MSQIPTLKCDIYMTSAITEAMKGHPKHDVKIVAQDEIHETMDYIIPPPPTLDMANINEYIPATRKQRRRKSRLKVKGKAAKMLRRLR